MNFDEKRRLDEGGGYTDKEASDFGDSRTGIKEAAQIGQWERQEREDHLRQDPLHSHATYVQHIHPEHHHPPHLGESPVFEEEQGGQRGHGVRLPF